MNVTYLLQAVEGHIALEHREIRPGRLAGRLFDAVARVKLAVQRQPLAQAAGIDAPGLSFLAFFFDRFR